MTGLLKILRHISLGQSLLQVTGRVSALQPGVILPYECVVNLQQTCGQCNSMTIYRSQTAQQLKQLINNEMGIEIRLQELVYNGFVMMDNDTLWQYAVCIGCTIDLLRGSLFCCMSRTCVVQLCQCCASPAGLFCG